MIDLTNMYNPKTHGKFPNLSSYHEMPIVIDNGSYQFRAGFASESKPYFQFKNVIAKPKLKKDSILVGNEIDDIYANIRYAFDRNVVVNYDVQESVFDYVFDRFGLQSLQEHAIVINEPLCNPITCRQQMSELLFEAYDVPSVAYYIDGLASYAYNNPEYLETTATDTVLIISFGYQSIHLMPLFSGRMESKLCRKINIGGSQLDSMMMRLLQLKYACHSNSIDLKTAEYLQQKTCRLAIDYRTELLQWKNPSYVAENSLKVQMAFKKSEKMLTNEQLEERKKQQAIRGKEMHLKKNQEKMLSAQESLSNLRTVIASKDNFKKKTLKSLGFESEHQAMSEIKTLEETIERLQYKIDGVECPSTTETKEQKSKYDLIDISDDELDYEELKQKQKQIMLRAAAMRREQIRLLKELQRNKILNAVSKLEESRDDDYALWVMNLRHQRQSLLDNRMKKRCSTSLAMATSGPSVGIDERRQQKARKIRKLAAELNENVESKRSSGQSAAKVVEDDYFGEEVSDDDSDTEQKQLAQLEILLGQYDPEFTKDSSTVQKCDIDEYYRLHLTTEQMRQKKSDKYLATFIHTAMENAKSFEEENFSLNFESSFTEDPTLDAWRGACKLALHTQFDSMSISREAYDEMGHDYIQEHPLSNFFYTPLTDIDEISN